MIGERREKTGDWGTGIEEVRMETEDKTSSGAEQPKPQTSSALLKVVGRVSFFLLWPLIWFYAPLVRRVRIIVITPTGIVLVKNVLGPGQWQLPGGGIRFGESVEAAAKRELQEELGIKTSHLQVLNDEPIICQQWGLLFRLHIAQSHIDGEPKHHSRAITDTTVRSKEELDGVSAEVKQAIRMADRYRV